MYALVETDSHNTRMYVYTQSLTSHSGTFSLNLRPIPATVPPVPAPHTIMSTRPGGEGRGGEGRGEGRGEEGRGGEGRGEGRGEEGRGGEGGGEGRGGEGRGGEGRGGEGRGKMDWTHQSSARLI